MTSSPTPTSPASPVSSFINNGVFEKTGGGGVSDVTSNFVNNGELDVLSGKVVFSGGFTNTGVIHGLVTQSGGVTTISAQTPSDFNGDALSDILWQNTTGQGAIWEMNGLNQIPGGSALVGPNPGPSWTEIGTGDFNGDGHADILWQNANGQAAIWEMNGLNQIDRRQRPRRPQSRDRVGKRSEPATSTATACPTSCGRIRTGRPRSGK